MLYALIWTLPAQKLLLLSGLAWKYGEPLQLADLGACLPETFAAGLLTAVSRQWQHLGMGKN